MTQTYQLFIKVGMHKESFNICVSFAPWYATKIILQNYCKILWVQNYMT